jgi:hypothetical protein
MCLNNTKPDSNIPLFTQNTKLTGITKSIMPKPTITFPVGMINPKKMEIIAPINNR